MFYEYRRYLSKKHQQTGIPMLPERIVFYRDGVSEGEIQRVVEDEIERVKSAFCLLLYEIGPHLGFHRFFRPRGH